MKREIIELFEQFSSVEFQLESWFNLGSDVSSPNELFNRLDDLFVEEWVNENEIQLGKFTKRYILDFLDIIEVTPDYDDPWVAFSSVEWAKIRLMALVIYKRLTIDSDG